MQRLLIHTVSAAPLFNIRRPRAMTTFDTYINNVYATLSSAHESGATSLVLDSGQGAQFGSSFPMLVTAITFATYRTTSEQSCIFTVTNRSGDTLTVAGTPAEGTLDPGFDVGDIVEMRFTAGEANQITSAINDLETGTSLPTTDLAIDSCTSVITPDTVTGGAVTCNLATSNWHSMTFVENTTVTLSNVGTNQQFTFVITSTGGPWTLTIASATVKWPATTEPTLTAGGIDVLTFKQISTNNYLGFIAGQEMG